MQWRKSINAVLFSSSMQEAGDFATPLKERAVRGGRHPPQYATLLGTARVRDGRRLGDKFCFVLGPLHNEHPIETCQLSQIFSLSCHRRSLNTFIL